MSALDATTLERHKARRAKASRLSSDGQARVLEHLSWPSLAVQQALQNESLAPMIGSFVPISLAEVNSGPMGGCLTRNSLHCRYPCAKDSSWMIWMRNWSSPYRSVWGFCSVNTSYHLTRPTSGAAPNRCSLCYFITFCHPVKPLELTWDF